MRDLNQVIERTAKRITGQYISKVMVSKNFYTFVVWSNAGQISCSYSKDGIIRLLVRDLKSQCCNGLLVAETDLCSKCKEHTGLKD